GVIPRLQEVGIRANEIHGSWDTSAPVQYCRSPNQVPGLPPPDDTPRFLLFTASDLSELPEWITAESDPDVRTFPVGPLSLIEAHDFVFALLGEPMEISSMHRLAKLAGWVPAALSGLVRECQAHAG